MIKAQGLTDLQQSLSFVTRPISYSYVQKCFLNKTIRDNNVHSKSREPKTIFKNLRPICLLNVVYKLASGCIAERIKGFLDKIIHCDQTGFIKGRFIGENIRLVYDIMHYTEIIQVPGLLMLIDFEKAFVTVSWNFIQDALQ